MIYVQVKTFNSHNLKRKNGKFMMFHFSISRILKSVLVGRYHKFNNFNDLMYYNFFQISYFIFFRRIIVVYDVVIYRKCTSNGVVP